MAIAFDTSVEAVRTDTSDPMTWTHTPVGTPRAIVVALVHGTSATDHVSTVTYGGVSMSRTVRATDTATEPGAAELWFLGSGIPTGAQTVSADLTSGTTDDIHGVSMSFTANTDTQVVDSDSLSENAANPSVTLQYAGRTCMAVAALYGGGADPTAFAENGNCTRVQDHDLGAFFSAVCRQTTAGSSDFAIGGTASSDDVAYVALAVSESVVNTSITPTVGSLTLAGVASSAVQSALRTALIGALAVAGLAGSLLLGTVVRPTVGSLTGTGQPMIYGPAAYTQAGTLFFGIDQNTSLTPSVGSLAITGVASSMGTGLVGSAGSLTLTGETPTVEVGAVGTSRTPTIGSLTLTGIAPTLALALTPQVGSLLFGDPLALTPYPAALTMTEGEATAIANTWLTPTVGSLSVTGVAGRNDRGLLSTVGTLTMTEGQGLTLAQIAPNTGVLSLLGQTPTGTSGPILIPSTATLQFTGTNPPANLVALPTVGSLTLTGSTPLFSAIRPSAGSMTLTAFQPGQPALQLQPGTGSLFFGVSNELPTGAMAFTGYAPKLGSVFFPLTGQLVWGLSLDVIQTPLTATLVLTGLQARPNPPDNTSITPDSGVLRLYRVPQPLTGTLGLTGIAASLAHSLLRTPTVGSLTLTGQTVTSNSPSVTPSVGSLLLTGYQPTAVNSGSANRSCLPGTGLLALNAAAGFLSAGIVPTSGTSAISGVAANVSRGIVPSSGSLAMVGISAGLPIGVSPATGTLAVSGVAAAFLGRPQPGTGALTLDGLLILTGSHPIIATSIDIEGTAVGITGTAQEGSATTGVSLIEGASSVTFPVGDYV